MAIAAIVIAVVLAFSPAGRGHSSGYNVRLGIEFNTHATAAWVALNLDLFDKYGVHVSKIVKYRTGMELAAAFTHGDVDAAWACLAPILKMIDKGAKIYIVSAAHYYGYGCIGRPGITSIEQLRSLGRVKVAVTGNGAPVHVLALLVAERYGINMSIVFIKPPAILSAVLNGAVDIACLPEHYLSIAEAKGLHVLVTAQDIWPGMPGSYLVVSSKLLEENPKLVCLLARINKEATEYALSHLEEATRIDAKELGIPANIAERSLSRLKLTWKLNIDQMQKLADIMYEHRLIKHRIDITEYIVNLTQLCGGG